MATMSVQKRYNSSCVTMRLTPFFTFSEEKAAQEVPSAVFGYPFQAFRPRLFCQVSTKCELGMTIMSPERVRTTV